jgi:hypothetical protein
MPKGWDIKFPATCECCGCKGRLSKDYYYCMREDRISGRKFLTIRQATSHSLGKNKIVFCAWKINLRKKLLNQLGLQVYDSKLPLPDPVILQPEKMSKHVLYVMNLVIQQWDVLRQEIVITS